MSSAFSKIEKSDSEPEAEFRPTFLVPTTGSASSVFPGIYPGFYPPLFSSHMQHGASVANSASRSRSPTEVNDRVSSASVDDGKIDAIPEKNMYYYVDPRIPFTNYFLNLTKLLSGSSKDYNEATTPLTKLGSEETRADDHEPAVSPQSTKSPRSIFSPQSTISPISTVSSPKKRTPSRQGACTFLKLNAETASGPSESSSSQNAAFPFSNISEKFVTGSLDPRFMSPFAGSLPSSVVQQQDSMFHLSGTSIFHPALLPFPAGPGMRRLNLPPLRSTSAIPAERHFHEATLSLW
ncbi:hypothetical protein DPMN_014961 [Dreissena polymorpha]|uniref:Uncharacterized protein n=1 Tax=Dreissena polymorpha TaxID=45954 RepID=A0A9D4N6Y5_DREPO|nr:hypothetical protein DPMN_014961 [Dreissena polymorpha]